MRIQGRTLSPDSQLSAPGSHLSLKVGLSRREGRSHLLSSISNLRVNALRAFTLIEFIGVLAVLAILAALTVPAVIRQIDEAAWSRERTDLTSISNSLVLNILSTKTIPSETAMAQAVANWSRQPLTKIVTNPRRNTRAFVIDGSKWPGAITPDATSQVWTQPPEGIPSPAGARIIVVSSTGTALPINSGSLSSSEFDSVWNAAERTIPSVWSWTGRGEDLVIQRINLEPLFHRLLLINRDPLQVGKYSIQPSAAITSLAPRATTAACFLNGTDVTFRLPDDVPQERILLTEDKSYAFSGSRWGGDYYGSGYEDETAEGFAYWAFRFMKAGQAPHVQQGATPEGAVAAMYDFMLVFSLWANKCVGGTHFPTYGANSDITVPEYVLLEDIAGGGTGADSSFLPDFTGLGGLMDPPPINP